LNQLLARCEPAALVFSCPIGKAEKRGNHYESTEASDLMIENFHSSSVMILTMLFSDGVLCMSAFWRNIILLSA
jgi:hypothetical protein